MIIKRLTHYSRVIGLSFTVISCGGGENTPAKATDQQSNSPQIESVVNAKLAAESKAKSTPQTILPVTALYLKVASQKFDTARARAEGFYSAINQLATSPSNQHLDEAKETWLAAHKSYAATRTFSFINIKHSLLDHSQIDPVQHAQTIRIDQSPLLPGYLDSVEGYPQSGYTYSPLPIDATTLNQEHQFSDPLYVTLGFHSVEFLLWGENPASARKSSDFAATTNPPREESPNYYEERRTQLTLLVATLLLEDIKKQSSEWINSKGYYPIQLATLSEENQTAYINESIERSLNHIMLQKASLQKQGKESIHSGYANSDHDDLISQLLGIKELLNSKEWAAANTQNKAMTAAAKSLRTQYEKLAADFNVKR